MPDWLIVVLVIWGIIFWWNFLYMRELIYRVTASNADRMSKARKKRAALEKKEED